MQLARFILRTAGWRFKVNIPETPKCVICVAPHTSNWDFIMGELGIRSAGMKAGFLMKSTWFFFPLGCLLRAIGGVAVHRGGGEHSSVTQTVVDEFSARESLAIAITPEGTRSLNPHWHKGLLVIAKEANVPVVLAYIDYKNKVACLDTIFEPTGDHDADLASIRKYYADKGYMARFPEKFTAGLNND